LIATVSAATAHPIGWHGGFPTGRPWDFAFGSRQTLTLFKGVAVLGSLECDVTRIQSRTRFLGSGRLFAGALPRQLDCGLGSDASTTRRSLSSQCDASRAAILTRTARTRTFFASISFGWPDRWPPAPAVPAIDCFARLTVAWKPVSVCRGSLFLFRRSI
jgi:hypothetical protein